MIRSPHYRMTSLVLLCSASWASVCPAADTKGSLPKVSKNQPFINSLGMKFVPVPDTAVQGKRQSGVALILRLRRGATK